MAVRILLSALLLCVLAGCEARHGADQDATRVLRIWAHAGQESERNTLRAQVERFNTAHQALRVRLTFIPEGSYNAQVQAAAVADELPDALELDGPFLYRYVWQGRLTPVDQWLSEATLKDLLPTLVKQGTYRNHLYGVGTFDSGLALYADRRRLAQVGARIPRGPAQAWNVGEFGELLRALARTDHYRSDMNLKHNYAGEWYTYAFSPFLQSAGGDLIDRRTYATAEGVLNGPDSVRAMTTIQSWIRRGYVDPNIDGGAFTTGRVALAVGGHWNYEQYATALGKNLLLLPLPDMGHGSRTGQGSWLWAVTRRCRHPERAAEFLAFLLSPREVLAMADANSAVPGTRTAVQRSGLYREGGPLRLFVTQLLDGYAVPRPRTPAYPVITAEFQQAFDRIRAGGNVQEILDRAAAEIDEDIQDNEGYRWVGERRGK